MKQISGVGDVKRFKCVGWKRNLQSTQEADKWVSGVLVFTMVLAHMKNFSVICEPTNDHKSRECMGMRRGASS